MRISDWSSDVCSSDPRPGKAACASSSSARLSGPPDTATASFPSPIAPFSASTASRKRWAASGGALSRDTCLRRLILEGRAHLRAIDVGQLAIDLAGLLRLVELHQRLPQPIKAVGSAIPPGVVLIIGVERLHRHGGLVIRQIGAAKPVLRIAGALVLGI